MRIEYEKPVCVGWSTDSMFETLLHEYRFDMTVPLASILHGPFSWKSLIMEDEPGPPLIQTVFKTFSSKYCPIR